MLLKRKIQNLLKKSIGLPPNLRPFSIFNPQSFFATSKMRKKVVKPSYPFEAVENAKTLFKSLIEKQLLNDEEMNKLLDVCIFLKQMNLHPEISYQQHQNIILTIYQIMQNKQFSFPLMRKFVKYAQKFNIISRINSSTLLLSLLQTKVFILEDQKNLPEILNFFSHSNAPKKDILRLLDKIVPLYDKNLVEIEDSTLISLFYHIVFFDWRYDKKPNFTQPKGNNTHQMNELAKKEIESSDLNDFENNLVSPPKVQENSNNVTSKYINNKEFEKFKSINSNPVIKAMELELGHRLSKFKLSDFLEFSKILSLNILKNYESEELFSEYQKVIIERLDTLSEQNISFIVNNLRFFKNFTDEFCEKFEKIMIKNINNYRTSNLFNILRFVRCFSFKPRSPLVYHILLLINKNSMKSIGYVINEGIELYGKDRENFTFLINDLIFFAANKIEEDYMLKYSFFPKNILQIYWYKISRNSQLNNNMIDDILEKINEVRNIRDFKKLLMIANKININDIRILDKIFNSFKIIDENNELCLHDYCVVFVSFHDLNYYIEMTSEKDLYMKFLKQVNKKLRAQKVYENYILLKILAVYIRIASSFNNELLQSFIESFNYVVDNTIKEGHFFILIERVEIIKHLLLSRATCDRKLLEMLYSYFSSKKNHYFQKEADYIPRNDNLYRITERTLSYYPDLKIDQELLKILEESKNLSEKSELASQPMFYFSIFSEQIKTEIYQYLTLMGVLDQVDVKENVYKFSFEIDMRLTDKKNQLKDIYIDFHGTDSHSHINNSNIPTAYTLAKGDFLRNCKGVQYVEIFEDEWLRQKDKKSLLMDKLKQFLSN